MVCQLLLYYHIALYLEFGIGCGHVTDTLCDGGQLPGQLRARLTEAHRLVSRCGLCRTLPSTKLRDFKLDPPP